MKFFVLIASNLKRKKLRTWLTLLSIVVVFILFGLLSALKQALVGGVSMAGANRLMVQHKVSLLNLLPVAYKDRMQRIKGVALATHQTWFGGTIKDSKDVFFQTPVVPNELLDMFPELVLPNDQKEVWFKTRTGAIIGRALANQMKWTVGMHVPITSPIWPKADGNQTWEFDIVGIYDAKDKKTDTTSMFFHYDYFDEGRGRGKGQVGWYSIRVQDPAQAADVAKLVDQEFENSDEETKTAPEAVIMQSWAKQVGDIGLIVASILGAGFFMLLLVTGNTVAQSVRERTGELGVLKAIGFTNGQVLALVLAESCLLAVLGGGIGLGFASLMVPAIAKPLATILPTFFFPGRDLLLGAGLCILLGLATGILPALGAMRLRIADSLRRM
jgi:putative ABC transport system permease protein